MSVSLSNPEAFFESLKPKTPTPNCTMKPQISSLSRRFVDKLKLNLGGLINQETVDLSLGNIEDEGMGRTASMRTVDNVDLNLVLAAIGTVVVGDYTFMSTPVEDNEKFTFTHDLCPALSGCGGEVTTYLSKTNGMIAIQFTFTKG